MEHLSPTGGATDGAHAGKPDVAAGRAPDPAVIGWDDPIDLDELLGSSQAQSAAPAEQKAFVPEQLTAVSALDPGRTTLFDIVASEEVAMGVEEKHVRTIRTPDGRTTTMLERAHQDDLTTPEQACQEYIAAWKAMRDAGLPVVPEVFVTSRSTLLVTDVKADGSELYGKGLRRAAESYHPEEERVRPRPELDATFIGITSPEAMPAVVARVDELCARAQAHGIELPVDDPFEMVVRPDGSWDLITLDVRLGNVHDLTTMDDAERRHLQANGLEVKQTFLGELEKLRNALVRKAEQDAYLQNWGPA
ncbi:MAG TPA: hypothetical protein VLF71_05680 [Candidatus Saccharimonadales bacterium]|nr:hypothetical protein [Candidatus Saccharimonadales bacterium]